MSAGGQEDHEGQDAWLSVLPDSAAHRRWVRRRTTTRGPLALIGDIYTAVLGAAVVGALVVPRLLRTVPLDGGAGTAQGAEHLGVLAGLDPGWLVVSAALLGLSLVVAPLGRLGPLFLRPYEAAWLLGLPGDRTGLLEPVARTLLAVLGAAGALAGAGLAVAVGGSPLGALGAALLGGGLGMLVLTGLIVCQLEGRDTRVVRAPIVLTAGAAALASAVTEALPATAAEAACLAAGTACLVVAAAWFRHLESRFDRMEDARLLQAVAQSMGAHVSLLSLDTRALGRVLAAPPRQPAARARMRLLAVGRRWPRPARTALAIAQGDLILLSREPHRLIQVVVGLLIALVPQLAAGSSGGVRCVAYALGGWVATLALAEPARRAWFDSALDASWPAGQLLVRTGHLVAPTAIMTLWTTCATAPLWGRVPAALALVPLAGLAWGGSALRSGFRAAPRFDMGLVASPVGSLPPGAVAMVISGPDAAAAGALPVLLLLMGAPVTPVLLGIQAVLTGAAAAWGLLINRSA